LPYTVLGIPAQEKAAVRTGMASNTVFLIDDQQDRIAIAIQANVFYRLRMARLFTLVP
jgi:hypothetical protein